MQAKNTLEELRSQIDVIDQQISQLLKQRLETVEKIKKTKEQDKITSIDLKREEEILARFDSKYEKEIFKKIIEESRKIQM